MTNSRQHALNRRGMMACAIMILLTMTALGVPVFAALAQDRAHVGEEVVLEGDLSDVQFVAGRSVTVRARVSDDVLAAGRTVRFDGASVRNAVVAGYDVEQSKGSATDFIAVAHDIRIAADVREDVIALGRFVRVTENAAIGRDAQIAGEEIEIDGNVAGSIRAAGRKIVIDGEVGGKVDLLAERIVIGPGAVISGDLVYRSGSQPEIAEGASVLGEIRRIEIDLPDIRSLVWTLIGIGLLVLLMWVLAGFVVTAVVAGVFPATILMASDRLKRHVWSHLGIGVAVMVLGTILAGAAYASIVGIPIGGFLSLLIALLFLFGVVTTAACIGLFVRSRIGRDTVQPGTGGLIGWTLLGVVLIGIVGLIPVIGAIVSGLAVTAGAGASAREIWRRLRVA